MSKPTGHDVSNPAALGWQWESDTTTYQLIALRGVDGARMMFGVRRSDGRWVTIRCGDQWTCDGTRKDFLRRVGEFLAAAQDDGEATLTAL